MRPLILAALFGFAAALPNTANAYEPLGGEEIAAQLIDRPFFYQGYEDGQRKEGRIVYEGTGKLVIRTRKGHFDGGSWAISNDEMCTRVKIGRGGTQRCFTVIREIDGSYVTSHKYRLYPVKNRRY